MAEGRGEGRPEEPATWVPHLEATAAAFHRRLAGTPDTWLERRVGLIDTPGSLSGWRVLMLMIEHEVAHRSQIDAYAGLEGWPVSPIFGRTFEDVLALQAQERRRHGRTEHG